MSKAIECHHVPLFIVTYFLFSRIAVHVMSLQFTSTVFITTTKVSQIFKKRKKTPQVRARSHRTGFCFEKRETRTVEWGKNASLKKS